MTTPAVTLEFPVSAGPNGLSLLAQRPYNRLDSVNSEKKEEALSEPADRNSQKLLIIYNI